MSMDVQMDVNRCEWMLMDVMGFKNQQIWGILGTCTKAKEILYRLEKEGKQHSRKNDNKKKRKNRITANVDK